MGAAPLAAIQARFDALAEGKDAINLEGFVKFWSSLKECAGIERLRGWGNERGGSAQVVMLPPPYKRPGCTQGALLVTP